MKKTYFIFLMILFGANAFGLDSIRLDLKSTWLKHEGGKFTRYDGKGRVVHFTLAEGAKGLLRIKGRQLFSVFINNKLVVRDQLNLNWLVDSLKTTYYFPVTISVFVKGGANKLSAELITVIPDDDLKIERVPYPDVIISISIILVVVLITLLRTNPQTTLDYFNFPKVFSGRNTDESVLAIRVTSSNNVFFYIFCSMVMAVNLLFFFNGQSLKYLTYGGVFYLILKFATQGFLVLIMRIIIVKSSAWLFGFSDFAPGQFYNFVRLLLVCFSVSSVVLVCNFMLGGQFVYLLPIIQYAIIGFLVVFVTVTFVKLNARGRVTVFHIFSYLCVSEIFPLVILLNLYFS